MREEMLNWVLDIAAMYYAGESVEVTHYDSHIAHAIIGDDALEFVRIDDNRIKWGFA
jgi:hypothetical protein